MKTIREQNLEGFKVFGDLGGLIHSVEWEGVEVWKEERNAIQGDAEIFDIDCSWVLAVQW